MDFVGDLVTPNLFRISNFKDDKFSVLFVNTASLAVWDLYLPSRLSKS